MSTKNKIILFLFIVILIIIFTPAFGGLYEKIIGRRITSWFLGGHPEYFEGFFVSYMFFVPLLLTLFKISKKVLLSAVIVVLLISLLSIEVFLVSLATAIIGWLLAQIILLISKQLKKS
ncbi:MAG: hypothetical protein WC610_02640 [Patescibacteria group bacterium]